MRSSPVIISMIVFLSNWLQQLNAAPAKDSIPVLRQPDSAIHFLVVGDWGMGNDHQRKVAHAMAIAAEQTGISFIVSTGDNFYPAGVTNTDDPHWTNTFRNIYQAPSLQRMWLVALGNHDHLGNADAQVKYSGRDNRWYMPARYFDTSIALGSDSILFIFLDTEPIEATIRNIPAGNRGYPENNVADQLSWMRNTLATSSARWKIVVGHHPLHTGGSRRHNRRVKRLRALLEPLLIAGKVNLYLSGHEHHLELLKPKGATPYYLISGAGAERKHVGWLKRWRIIAARKHGFASLSVSHGQCLIRFISQDGRLLEKFTIDNQLAPRVKG